MERKHDPDRAELLRLTQGVIGGIVAAKATFDFCIAKLGDKAGVWVYEAELAIPNEGVIRRWEVSKLEFESLAAQVAQGLENLPTEFPKGSEDIYGCNTRIRLQLPNLKWVNEPPTGCIRRDSDTRASSLEIQKFRQCVEDIKKFAMDNKGA